MSKWLSIGCYIYASGINVISIKKTNMDGADFQDVVLYLDIIIHEGNRDSTGILNKTSMAEAVDLICGLKIEAERKAVSLWFTYHENLKRTKLAKKRESKSQRDNRRMGL